RLATEGSTRSATAVTVVEYASSASRSTAGLSAMALTRLPSNRELKHGGDGSLPRESGGGQGWVADLPFSRLPPARRQLPRRLELELERLHDPLRVWHQPGVARDPQHHPARVADDADPQPEPPGLRHPEHNPVDLAAGQVKRLPWPGHVRQD